MQIEITGMAPLLQVFDMPESLKFYRDLLGFKVVQDSGQGDQSGWVLLKLEQTEIMLNTMFEDHERPDIPDTGRTSNHGDTALYFGCPDIDGLNAYLKTRGASDDEPVITGYGYKVISLTDPDGYKLCFHWPAQE